MSEHGNTKALEDVLSTSTIANMLRLKETFLSLARTDQEYQVIELLCSGYDRADIKDKLKVTRQRVEQVIKKYRKRIKQRLTPEQKDDIYSVLRRA